MAANTDRPLIMALSNPTSKCESTPDAVVDATGGRAFIATGSPFESVEHEGRMIPVSQCNNVYIFPAVGLASVATAVAAVTDGMFVAAAEALAETVQTMDLEAGRLFPPISDLRTLTRHIASAVAKEAVSSGAAKPMTDQEIEEAIEAKVWNLEYPTLVPV